MANIKRRTKIRKKALNLLEELAEDASNLLIIHYSCEMLIPQQQAYTRQPTPL